MKVDDHKIVTFEQEITSNDQVLAHLLRTIYFKPKCVGNDAYRNMLHLEINESVTFEDNSLINATFNQDLVQKIPIKNIQISREKIVKGLVITSVLNGAHCRGFIREIFDDYVIADMNRPWLGKALTVKISIKDIVSPPENFDPNDTSLNSQKVI